MSWVDLSAGRIFLSLGLPCYVCLLKTVECMHMMEMGNDSTRWDSCLFFLLLHLRFCFFFIQFFISLPSCILATQYDSA